MKISVNGALREVDADAGESIHAGAVKAPAL